MSALSAVEAASRRRVEASRAAMVAHRDLVVAVRAAIEAGESVKDVAAAAGVSTTTVRGYTDVRRRSWGVCGAW